MSAKPQPLQSHIMMHMFLRCLKLIQWFWGVNFFFFELPKRKQEWYLLVITWYIQIHTLFVFSFFSLCPPQPPPILSEGRAVTKHQVLINQGLRNELSLPCVFFPCVCGYTYMAYAQVCGGVRLWLQSGDWMIHMKAPSFSHSSDESIWLWRRFQSLWQCTVKANVQLKSNSEDRTWMVWMRNHLLPLTHKYFKPLMQKKCLFPFNSVLLPQEMNTRVLRPSMKVNAFRKKRAKLIVTNCHFCVCVFWKLQ